MTTNSETTNIETTNNEPTVTTSKKKKAAEKTRLIYIGPALRNGLLQRYTVFSAGVPDYLSQEFEPCPAFQRCFVPVEEFTEYESRMKDPTSAEAVFYRETEQYFAGKGNK